MPLRGKGHSDRVQDESPYFKCLAELDAWFSQPHDKLTGVLPYQPRPGIDGQSDSRGKLLVCHDYKGGYSESPSGLCYTFNFWHLCDTFVYFAHHRVTIPPSGWSNAAHKQGSKMLGTFILEGLDSEPDCLQLIVGHTDYVVVDNKIPISKRYAVLLAELAYQRGFDGYLLNFEWDLQHNTNHARALAAWILLLKAELRAKVGPHTEVVWYDSVIYDGTIQYQNRLDSFNLPFFLASDALFTNYWWEPETQNSMVQYFEKLHGSVPGPSAVTNAVLSAATKTRVYTGVDVWGRSQYGEGGFCCYRAITYTAPLGFSTAFFGPGWTWESATTHPEKKWNDWWDNERKLWLGPLKPGDVIPVPDSPEGPFKPMTAFFQNLPPLDPVDFVFHTNFSPGVGYSWFVEGKKVLETRDGWTDVDKQGSIGNLVWPWSIPSWEGIQPKESLPTASTALDMTDGYNGGNTLKLTLEYAGNERDDTISLIWLPIQSLTVRTRQSFEACVVYKTSASDDVLLATHIYLKSLSNEENASPALNVGQASANSELPCGWARQTINFSSTSAKKTTSVAIGFLVGFKAKTPSTKVTFSFSLGQLAVYPTLPPPSVSIGTSWVTGAKFTPTLHAAGVIEGTLIWDITSSFTPIDVQIDDMESVTPAWLLEDTPAYRFPTFAYFNVYVAPLTDVDAAVFIGTTGLDGRANRFYVEPACLPTEWDSLSGVRFYVQGVTDRGEVLPWEKCATVDHGKSSDDTTRF